MSDNNSSCGNTALVWLVILLAVLAVIFAPILYIWVLNTLFPILAIPYTWKTWLAMLVAKLFMLNGVSQARTQFKNK